MSELQPCEKCHRHIRIEETRCPFCESRTAPGNLVRAAALVGALAGSSALGCGKQKDSDKPSKSEAADTVAPAAIDASTAAMATAPSDASSPDAAAPIDAGAPDAKVAKAKKQRKKTKKKVEPAPLEVNPHDMEPPPMPYGAPPARRRLV